VILLTLGSARERNGARGPGHRADATPPFSISGMPTSRGVSENVIAGLIALAILAGLGWLISRLDASVPLWVVFAVTTIALAAGTSFGLLQRDRADLPRYQADLLGEVILALRDYAAGQLTVRFEDLIERGILAPARFGLSVVPGEEIRLSIIELDETGEAFKMTYESGHSLGRKENFSLSRVSLAGHAFDSKELQWTDDVDSDDRWRRHPKADEKRRYKSLAAMPIVVGDDAVAVLNVVSTEQAAFLKGDLTYIELLGGLVALAWNIKGAADPPSRIAVESSDLPRMET
jgi:GAF domain